MRTHGSNQFKADKSDSSRTSPYGRQHARTAELYRQRREQRAQQEQQELVKAANVVEQPVVQEVAPPPREVAQPAVPEQPEQPSGMARQAVASVLQVAKEVHPLQSARKLAGTVVSGAVRVAREVSARAKKVKGAGKKG